MAVDPKTIDWAENSYDERPVRICMACGIEDRAPRDSVGLPDGNVALYHKDCHAMLGCGVCKEELKAVAGGHGPKAKKNEALWLAILEENVKPEGERATIYTDPDPLGDYSRAVDNGQILDKNWKRAE